VIVHNPPLRSSDGPSRRNLLQARLSRPAYQIASLMVQARPEHMTALTAALNALPGVEVHGDNGQGRMVVSLEARDDQQLLDMISDIQNHDHVITASLVYHQIED